MGIIRKAINSGGMVRSRTVKQETARYTKKSYKLAKAGPQSKPATDAGLVASLGPLGLYILIGFLAFAALAILVAVIAFGV